VARDDGLGQRPKETVRLSGDGGTSFGPSYVVSDPAAAGTFPVVGLSADSLIIAWTQVTDSVHQAAMAARPDMSAPHAKMGLPRVGQQEVLIRRAAIAALRASASE